MRAVKRAASCLPRELAAGQTIVRKRGMRLNLFLILILACCTLLCGAGVTAAQEKSATSIILRYEAKWTEAYKQRNINILSSLLADDFVITIEDGSTYSKAGYITHSADSSVRVEVAELSDLKVRIHGNVAV